MSAYRDTAPDWQAAGWPALPLPPKRKAPPPDGWTGRDAPYPSAADVHAWTEDQPNGNLALRMPPGVLGVDVDDYDDKGGGDTLRARVAELGRLPKTYRITSRDPKGSLSGIYLYRVPEGYDTSSMGDRLGPGIEVIRPEHRYAVGPGSIHPEGRTYRLIGRDGTEVEGVVRPDDLPELPAPWAERLTALPAKAPQRPPAPTGDCDLARGDAYMKAAVEGIAADLRATAAWAEGQRDQDGRGWEKLTADAALRLRRLALAPWNSLTLEQAREAFVDAAPTGGGWTKRDVISKWNSQVKAAEKFGPADPPAEVTDPLAPGHRLAKRNAPASQGGEHTEQAGHGGAEQPATGGQGRAKARGPEEFPDPNDPMGVAEQLAAAWRHDGAYTIVHWRGDFFRWAGAHWAELNGDEMRALIYPRLHRAYFLAKGEDGEPEIHMWKPTRRKVADVLEALAVVVRLDPNIAPPGWTDGRDSGAVVPFKNGILDLRTRTFAELDPRLFTLWSLPFEYDPNAPPPTRWLAFLEQVFGQEPGAVDLLQEWFGYVISGQLSQKILLVIGPTRSGKGTISRTLAQLVGERNVAWPSLSGLTSSFGLQPLIGKPLGVIADARMAGDRTRQHVVESLLNISGEDSMTLDRKYRDPWTGTLPTRLMMLSNEVPAFSDASGTIAQRFIVLRMKRSFLGQEDLRLGEKLRAELPGILLWALQGLDRLNAAGRFTGTESTAETVQAMAHGASPVRLFVHERCVTGNVDLEVGREDLWKAWREWADDNNERPGGKEEFFRRLRSNVADLEDIRPRTADGARIRKLAGIALRPKCATIGCSVRAPDDLAPTGWQCADHRLRVA